MTDKRKSRQARKLSEDRIPLVYISPQKGITQARTGEALRYYGKVTRIPREELGKGSALTYDAHPEELLQDLKDAEPVAGGTVEQYEVEDMETGDLLIMWRVPYRQKPSVRKTRPKQKET